MLKQRKQNKFFMTFVDLTDFRLEFYVGNNTTYQVWMKKVVLLSHDKNGIRMIFRFLTALPI